MKLFQRTKDLCRNRRPFEELVGDGLVRDLCTEEIQSKSGPGSVARISDEEFIREPSIIRCTKRAFADSGYTNA